MKAVVVREFAPIEAARWENIDAAAPGPGEVAIDMRAAEVNFPDILVIEGKYQVKPPLPFSPGKAGAGVVAATGEGVTSISVGDHIAVQAEYVMVQGSLRQFPLSQFHHLISERFGWGTPSQALPWRVVQAVTNRLH